MTAPSMMASSPPDVPPAQRAPDASRLLQLIEAMAGQPVVVLADLVLDRFITGTPKRISREAPVLILSWQGERSTPGGGANAVANLAALGGRPLPLGIVGDDDSGRALVAAFEAAGIPTGGLRRRPGYSTPTKTRILGGAKGTIKQQIVRYDREESLVVDEADRRHFLATLAGWPRARAAVLSDYGYGAVEPTLLAPLAEALAPGGATLVDSRYRLPAFRGLTGATPNEEEAEALLGGELDAHPGGLAGAGGALLERLGARFLLVTRGSRGMVLFPGPGQPFVELPVHGTDQVADVTGAGDTVIAAFSLALAAGATPLEATLLANYAGGVVVMKMGTATLSPAELADAVRRDPAPLEQLTWTVPPADPAADLPGSAPEGGQ